MCSAGWELEYLVSFTRICWKGEDKMIGILLEVMDLRLRAIIWN
jgi:hypothetical protein